ncbi:MAG: sigma-70 family RNA polymerase sigma factor [Planctomycetota bacterium]
MSQTTQAGRWSEFLSVYVPFIEQQARRVGLSESDACDVRQNVLCVLIKELPNFKHNGNCGAFRCWLRKIVGNQLRSFRRKHYRNPEGSPLSRVDFRDADFIGSVAEDDDSVSAAWDQEFAAYLANRILNRVASRFDHDSLVAFRRQFFDEVPPADVATELGKTKPAVIAAKCRVLKALREEATRMKQLRLDVF